MIGEAINNTYTVTIEEQEETDDGWWFLVSISQKGHATDVTEVSVTVGESYWERITEGEISPEETVIKTIKFLLDREPKEDILKEFDISTVKKYFSDFEDEMKER